jgi:sarcosine oxidase subunit beta
MTPDGNPIVGKVNKIEGFINAVGMCGQGFMLGPGLGELLSRILTDKITSRDNETLDSLAYTRDFGIEEELK